MIERPGFKYSDPDVFEQDPIYPDDEYYQVVGLLSGGSFTRKIRVGSLEGQNEFEIPTKRVVMVAAIRDRDGNLHCEPYSPERHGSKIDLSVLDVNIFAGDTDFLDGQSSLERVRKKGASRQQLNTDEAVVKRGGDPDYRLPKIIFHPGKLK